MTTKTLKDYLEDWTDFDFAAFYLGVVSEIFNNDFNKTFQKNKHIFWTNNPLGNLLYNTLESMVIAGVLEMNIIETKFRWKKK